MDLKYKHVTAQSKEGILVTVWPKITVPIRQNKTQNYLSTLFSEGSTDDNGQLSGLTKQNPK